LKKRKLDNWLDAFMEWTLPRSETPESMLKWTGLFTLSTAIKRHVYWPRSLMGGYEIYPSLYVVFVGIPAVVRKSTTAGFGEILLTNPKLNGKSKITFAGDVTSHSKLLNALMESSDSSLAIISSEFSSLIQTSPEAMYEILTDIFDNKAKFDWSTWSHGEMSVKNPVINLLAATTPAWISAQPPEYFVGGGFASRILFVFEEKPRQKEIFYDHIDQARMKVLEDGLLADLVHIAHIKGECEPVDSKTKEFIREWYKTKSDKSDDEKLRGYYGRKHVHALKVATLFSLATQDDLKITKENFENALKLLEDLEDKMPQVFSSIGTNQYSQVMESILYFMKEKKRASLKTIAGRFYREGVTLEQLKSALAFLCTTGKITATGMVEPVYRYKGDKK